LATAREDTAGLTGRSAFLPLYLTLSDSSDLSNPDRTTWPNSLATALPAPARRRLTAVCCPRRWEATPFLADDAHRGLLGLHLARGRVCPASAGRKTIDACL